MAAGYAHGARLLETGSTDLAIEILAEAAGLSSLLEQPSVTAAVLLALGNALARKPERIQDAVIAYEEGFKALAGDPEHDLDRIVWRIGTGEKTSGGRAARVPDDLFQAPVVGALESAASDPLLHQRLLLGGGNAYLAQAQPKAALQRFELALGLPDLADRPLERAHLMVNAAVAERRMGDLESAAARLDKALAILDAENAHRVGRRAALATRASLELASGRASEAAETYRRAIDLYEHACDDAGMARALTGLGQTLLELERPGDALPPLQRAEALAEATGDRETKRQVWLGLGSAHRRLGSLAEARDYLERSRKEAKRLRDRLRTDEGKVAFFDSAAPIFDELLLLHVERAASDAGAWKDALEVSEAARGQALVDLLQPGPAPERPICPPRDAEEAAASPPPVDTPRAAPGGGGAAEGPSPQEEVGANSRRGERPQVTRGTESGPDDMRQDTTGTDSRFDDMRQDTVGTDSRVEEIGQDTLGTESFFDQIRQDSVGTDSRFDDMRQDTVGTESIRDIVRQDALGTVSPERSAAPDARRPPPLARLSFHVLEDRTIVFHVGTDGAVTGHIVEIGRQELVDWVRDLRGGLEIEARMRGVRGGGTAPRPGEDTPETMLQDLHARLLQPLAGPLAAEDGDLAIIPDGPLWHVPFAALADDEGTPLVARRAILLGSSWDFIERVRRRRPPEDRAATRLLAVGNPDFSWARAGETAIDFEPLPFAAKEAESIAAMHPGPSTLLVGGDAAGTAVTQGLLDSDVIHLATHGLADDADPLSSFVILAADECSDGRLTARQVIRDLKGGVSADLVVLSACQTGLGQITGDGTVGLSRSFLAAGARSVVVSLWSIDDAATRTLMESFYRAYFAGESKARALQLAMLALREDGGDVSPAYWAPFMLIGAED